MIQYFMCSSIILKGFLKDFEQDKKLKLPKFLQEILVLLCCDDVFVFGYMKDDQIQELYDEVTNCIKKISQGKNRDIKFGIAI